MSGIDEKEFYDDQKPESENYKHQAVVAVSAVDTAAALVSGEDVELTPEEEKRILRKIDFHILPLMCSTCRVCLCGHRLADLE
jgi:hypothetical protein